MQLKLRDQEFVIVDLETTGLYAAEGDQIIEFGALKVSKLEIEGPGFQQLVNPGRPIPESATAIHGISDADVKDCPTSDQVMPDFLKYNGSRIWVAQNAPFDLSFIMRDMRRMKLAFGEKLVIDTIKISKILFPNAGSHNLDVLMARLGISKTGSRHRSLDDCRFTAQVLIEFIKMLEKQGMDELMQIKDAFVRHDNILKEDKPKARGLFG